MVTCNTINQLVAEALMVAFAVVVEHELGERPTEVPLTQPNDPVQAFLFDRANKPLHVHVAGGCATRGPDHAHTGLFATHPWPRIATITS